MWAGEALVYILVAKAMGVDASLIVMVVAVAASNLATTVPSTSGGIGPFELLAKETLVRAGTGAGARSGVRHRHPRDVVDSGYDSRSRIAHV